MAMKPSSTKKASMARGGTTKKANMARGGTAKKSNMARGGTASKKSMPGHKMEEKLKRPMKAKAGASYKG